VNNPDRLTKPLIREGDTFQRSLLGEALTLIARRFSEIMAATGPDSLPSSLLRNARTKRATDAEVARARDRHQQHG